jgi:hypothetical protein
MFRMKKDFMVLKAPEGDNKEREYDVVSMTPVQENNASSTDRTPLTVTPTAGAVQQETQHGEIRNEETLNFVYRYSGPERVHDSASCGRQLLIGWDFGRSGAGRFLKKFADLQYAQQICQAGNSSAKAARRTSGTG